MGTFGCFARNMSQNAMTSSGVFAREWIMIPSAPATTYAAARSRASSRPFSRMRLSMRAMIMNSSVRCAALPAAIFLEKF